MSMYKAVKSWVLNHINRFSKLFLNVVIGKRLLQQCTTFDAWREQKLICRNSSKEPDGRVFNPCPIPSMVDSACNLYYCIEWTCPITLEFHTALVPGERMLLKQRVFKYLLICTPMLLTFWIPIGENRKPDLYFKTP